MTGLETFLSEIKFVGLSEYEPILVFTASSNCSMTQGLETFVREDEGYPILNKNEAILVFYIDFAGIYLCW